MLWDSVDGVACSRQSEGKTTIAWGSSSREIEGGREGLNGDNA